MTSRPVPVLLALLALLAPGAASAAEGTRKDDDQMVLGQPQPLTFREIERGFWFSVEATPILHMEWLSTIPPTHLPRQLLPDDFGPGLRAGGRMGYDFARLFSVDGYLVGQFRDMRVRRGRSASGDFSDLTAGVGLRLMPVTLFDRLSFTGRVGVGGAILAPGAVARSLGNPNCILPPPDGAITEINPTCVELPGIRTPSNPLGIEPFPKKVLAFSPTAEVTGGVEYFTKLRHFSVGVEGMLSTVVYPLTFNVGVVPHIKYTF